MFLAELSGATENGRHRPHHKKPADHARADGTSHSKADQYHSSAPHGRPTASGESSHQSQQPPSSSSSMPNGMGAGTDGLKHRRPNPAAAKPTANGSSSTPAAAAAASAAANASSAATPEQRALVTKILKAKDFYEILSVARDASDEDIKRAYRKVCTGVAPHWLLDSRA